MHKLLLGGVYNILVLTECDNNSWWLVVIQGSQQDVVEPTKGTQGGILGRGKTYCFLVNSMYYKQLLLLYWESSETVNCFKSWYSYICSYWKTN